MKLLISPGLLIALCYALLSGGEVRVPPRQPGTLIVSTGALAAIGVVLMWALAILVPLMLTVLFRLGSPFKSMDPLVLLALIRRSPSRYIACLVSIIVLGGFALGLYLVLSRIPVPPGIPGLGFVARPGPALTLAGVLALVWAITALGRYGRWVSWCLDEDEE
jgi:hypothetical protein